MKSIVKMLGLVVLILLAFALVTGCNAGTAVPDPEGEENGGEEEKGIVIGKVPILLANPYHQADAAHFERYAKEQYGVSEVVIIDAEIDSATAVAALDQLIAMGVDAISFHSIDPDAALPGIKEARDSGIPIITFYTYASEQLVPHVTINEAPTSFEMGVIAATKWKEFYPDIPIKVGLIEYIGVPQPIAERSEPFIAGVLSVDPDAEIVSRLDGGGTLENAMAASQDMIVAHPEINILYGTSADYSLGALAALEAAGRGKAVDGVPLTEILVGTDAAEAELVRLFDPTSSLKITQGLTPKENAMLKVDTLMAMLNGEIELDAQVEFAGSNKVFDYWSSDVDEAEAWMEEQYMSTVSLR
jgi:ABC-type sugar transport system substrate-binding protein